MSYNVFLLAEAWTTDEKYDLEKYLVLPFPPFPGLKIGIVRYDVNGDVSQDLRGCFEEAGFTKNEDVPDDYEIREVVWVPSHARFDCRSREGVEGCLGWYRCQEATPEDLEQTVRYLRVFGFQVRHHFGSRKRALR